MFYTIHGSHQARFHIPYRVMLWNFWIWEYGWEFFFFFFFPAINKFSKPKYPYSGKSLNKTMWSKIPSGRNSWQPCAEFQTRITLPTSENAKDESSVDVLMAPKRRLNDLRLIKFSDSSFSENFYFLVYKLKTLFIIHRDL